MPMAMIRAYLERIPALVAEAKMQFVDLFVLPHMQKERAEHTFDSWVAQAGIPKPPAIVADSAILAMLDIEAIEV